MKTSNHGFKYEITDFSKAALLEQISQTKLESRVWTQITVTDLLELLTQFGFEVEIAPDDGADVLYLEHLGVGHGIQFYRIEDDAERHKADLAFGLQIKFPEDSIGESLCNQWNDQWIFGKCYINEDSEVVLQADMLLRGGVTSWAIAYFIVEYLDLFDDLQKFIDQHGN